MPLAPYLRRSFNPISATNLFPDETPDTDRARLTTEPAHFSDIDEDDPSPYDDEPPSIDDDVPVINVNVDIVAGTEDTANDTNSSDISGADAEMASDIVTGVTTNRCDVITEHDADETTTD